MGVKRGGGGMEVVRRALRQAQGERIRQLASGFPPQAGRAIRESPLRTRLPGHFCELDEELYGQALTEEDGQGFLVDLEFLPHDALEGAERVYVGAIIIVDILVVEAAHHRYDLNRNGVVERDEALRAVSDYFGRQISKETVIEVIGLYFAG